MNRIEHDCPALALILTWWCGLDKWKRWNRLRRHSRRWLRLDNDGDVAILGAIYAAEHKIKFNIQKIGRNEPCPCGSGRKYKKCCEG